MHQNLVNRLIHVLPISWCDLHYIVLNFQPIQKLQRPVVEPSSSNKVPTNVRQRYLNLLIDECLKLYKKAQEAFDRVSLVWYIRAHLAISHCSHLLLKCKSGYKNKSVAKSTIWVV